MWLYSKRLLPCSDLVKCLLETSPYEGGNLLLTSDEYKRLSLSKEQEERFIRKVLGSNEFINGKHRYCIWIDRRTSR